MSETMLKCPHCHQSLEVPRELLGQVVACPSCTGAIQLPMEDAPPLPQARGTKRIYLRKRRTAGLPLSRVPSVGPLSPQPPQVTQERAGLRWFFVIPLSAIVGGVVWLLQTVGVVEQNDTIQQIRVEAEKEMRRIEQDVAADAVRQYEIVKRSGSAMDAYVHAGIVAAAYLQAKDELNYRKWKNIERQEAAQAGFSLE